MAAWTERKLEVPENLDESLVNAQTQCVRHRAEASRRAPTEITGVRNNHNGKQEGCREAGARWRAPMVTTAGTDAEAAR